MISIARALMLGLSGVVLACSTTDAPSLETLIDEHLELVNQRRALICGCPEYRFTQTSAECLAQTPAVGETEKACAVDALDFHREEADDFLTCANEAQRAWNDCIASLPGCNIDQFSDCSAQYGPATANCSAPIGQNAWIDFDLCIPEP